MLPHHRVSRTAIDLIKRFEGYRRKAAELPGGGWTIGHGHTVSARAGAEVSEEDAEALLLYDLIGVAHGINEAVFAPLTQNQFDALASFVFGVGLENFRHSGVLKRLNEGSPIQAACSMELWRKAEIGGERIVIDALVRRRAVEKALFLTPQDGVWTPAPSPILRAMLDTDAFDLVPRRAPSMVTAGLSGDQIVVERRDPPQVAGEGAEADEADEVHGPALAAAEIVTQRLRTIFPDGEADAETTTAEEPKLEEARPQADFAPPIQIHAEPEAGPEPFTLRSPDPQAEVEEDEEEDALIGADDVVGVAEEGLSNRDLFEDLAPPSASDSENDLAFLQRFPEPVAEHPDRPPEDRAAKAEFVAPPTRRVSGAPKGGLVALIASAVLGLAFFGGGVFWATNARPTGSAAGLDPRIVGWLAGVAGVALFAVAVFLLLERLGAAAERAAGQRR